MNKFQITLYEDDDPEIFKRILCCSPRKYQNLKFDCSPKFDWSFLSEKPIRQVIIYVFDFNLLLSVKESLEVLHIRDSFPNHEGIGNIKWNRLKQVKLMNWIDSYQRILPHTLEWFSVFYYSGFGLMNFINQQNNLKHLKIEDCTSIELDDKAYDCRVKLDSLCIIWSSFSPIFALKILENQLNCLKNLKLNCSTLYFEEFAAVGNRMENLERLDLKCVDVKGAKSQIYCLSLKFLSIHVVHTASYFDYFVPLIRSCFNLEQLSYKGNLGDQLILPVISKCLHKLKSLEVEYNDEQFYGADFESLTKIRLNRCSCIPKSSIKFDNLLKSCPELQEIEVAEIGCLENLEIILKEAQKLKVLSISDDLELPENFFENIRRQVEIAFLRN